MGLVYILVNPCLPGWVKIGMTENDDIEERLSRLNAPANIPLSFRCYATYKTEKPGEVENCIHKIIDTIDNSLRAREELESGKKREREFFQILPEAAYEVFEIISKLRGDKEENLKMHKLTSTEIEEKQIGQEAISQARRKRNTFSSLGIPVGSTIVFKLDNSVTAKVVDDVNRVEFEGETYSVTALAYKLLTERQGRPEDTSINGWMYFSKDGKILNELREDI
jgi:hypothetical protein